MKAIKVMATVDPQGSLAFDHPLDLGQNSRVEVIILVPENEDNPTQTEILQDFRQAWHEAMTGQTIPLTQLWEGIENV